VLFFQSKTLLHLIDVTEEDLIRSYKQIRAELGKYSKSLLKKNEIIVLNKIDLIDKKNLDSKKKILSGKIKKKIYDLSTLDKSKISKIKSKLLEYVF